MASRADYPDEYNGESGDLGRMETGWFKRVTADDAELYQPNHDEATDVAGIALIGMGMLMQLFDGNPHPHTLAVLYPATKHLFLSMSLLHYAPQGIAAHSTFVWRKAIDASPLVRFLVAWALASMTTVAEPRPLMFGFCAPHETPTVATMQRRIATMRRVAQLMAPRPRLYGQIHQLLDAYPPTRQEDDSWLIPALAEMNQCPPTIVRFSLESYVHQSWTSFASGLLEDLPMLSMSQKRAIRWVSPLPNTYNTGQPIPERQMPQLCL